MAKLSVEIPKRNLPEVVLQTSKSVAVAAKKLEVDEDGDLVVPRRKGNTEGEEDLLVEIAIFIGSSFFTVFQKGDFVKKY